MLHHFSLFVLAVLTINLLPGPDMLYIITQSVSHGRRLGVAATLGISSGCFVHTFAISIGLSSLIFNSAFAFSLIKFVGAAYLVYLGVMSFIKKPTLSFNEANISLTTWRKVYLQGLITNVFNPKVALFFLAFLPQFVETNSRYSVAMQLLLLGLFFNFSGTIVNMFVAWFFGSAKNWLNNNPIAIKIQQKITGIILIGLGLRIAASGRLIA